MKSKTLWWPFLKQHKLKVAFIIFFGFVVSYCTLLLPLSIGKYFETSFGDGNNKTRALELLGIHLPGGTVNFFNFFLQLMGIKFLGSWGYNYFASLFGESFVEAQRRLFLQYHLEQRKDEIKVSKASLLLPFSGDVKAMQRLLVKGVLGLIKDVLFLAMALYVLFSLQAKLTLAVIIMTILFYCMHRWFNLVHKPLYARKRKKQADLLNHVAKLFDNRRQLTGEENVILNQKMGKLHKTLTNYHSRKSLLTAITPFMLYLMLAVIMAIASWSTGTGKQLPGEMIVYILLLMTLFPTIRNIIRIEHTWVEGGLAAEKFIRAYGTVNGEKQQGSPGKGINSPFSLLQSGIKGN